MGSEVIGIFAVFFIAVVIIGGTAWFTATQRKKEIDLAKDEYLAALDYLEGNPANEDAKAKVFETGNYYYGLINPDTNVLHYSEDGLPIGTYGFEDNSLERQESIKNDIDNRIGKREDQRAA